MIDGLYHEGNKSKNNNDNYSDPELRNILSELFLSRDKVNELILIIYVF
jgi:hypothetical protein